MYPDTTHILIADDMPTMRQLIRGSLEGLGFKNFTVAFDGKEALEKLNVANPPIQLIVSDWNMPNMSGFDFLKAVRADARFKGVPFLLVTTVDESSQVIDAIVAGADNYLLKPFTAEAIKEKLLGIYKKRGGK